MIKRTAAAIGVILAIGLSACSTTNADAEESATVNDVEWVSFHGAFPASWSKELVEAMDMFSREGLDSDCFVVLLQTTNNNRIVNFVSERTIESKGTKFELVEKIERCGRGVSFEFDETGAFVRKFYERH